MRHTTDLQDPDVAALTDEQWADRYVKHMVRRSGEENRELAAEMVKTYFGPPAPEFQRTDFVSPEEAADEELACWDE